SVIQASLGCCGTRLSDTGYGSFPTQRFQRIRSRHVHRIALTWTPLFVLRISHTTVCALMGRFQRIDLIVHHITMSSRVIVRSQNRIFPILVSIAAMLISLGCLYLGSARYRWVVLPTRMI